MSKNINDENNDNVNMKETEMVYKELSKVYCICNHRKNKHLNEEYQCQFSATDFRDGKVTIFKCECKLFQPLEHSGVINR